MASEKEREESDPPVRRSSRVTRTMVFDNVKGIPPVFVVSRIANLSNYIKNMSLVLLKHEINVTTVKIPETTDLLCDDEIDLLEKAEIIVIDPAILQYHYTFLKNAKWVHCTWAGIENLFRSMTKKPNFMVSRHSGERFCNLMAEYVMSCVLIFERNFMGLQQCQSRKEWKNDVMSSCSYRSLDQLTILVLGVGNMGQAVAKFFKERKSTIFGFARTSSRRNTVQLFDKIGYELNEDILAHIDYIVNTLPCTTYTYHLLTANTFKVCMKSPVFINVGRGNVISEEELVEAYKVGFIGGMALDVFEEEPLPVHSELWNLKNVLITPHCSAISKPEHVAENFLQSLMLYRDGKTIPNVVDWDAEY